jgi:hypothetical protein
MSERCARCGCEDEDLRTLWMSCWYEMSELGLPFEEKALSGTLEDKIGARKLRHGTVPIWGAEPAVEVDHLRFFTLRVCKRCRAEWMQGIAQWFEAGALEEEEPSPRTGVFVRELGETRELTEAEVLERWPDWRKHEEA